MSLVLGAFTMGLILALLSLGMLISFRMIRFTDISVDGTITLGSSVTAVCLASGMDPWPAVLLATAAGCAAVAVTGILHTRFHIQELLSGILVMTALYSINLRIMGRSNIPLLDVPKVADGAEGLVAILAGAGGKIDLLGWPVPIADVAAFVSSLLICVASALLLRYFLLTHLGTALRAAGNNPQMARAQGFNHQAAVVFGLALANGLVALAGSLLAQYQGFSDVQMGIGMMVWGLASIIIGEALVRHNGIGLMICGTILGTILFRLLIAIALRWGLNPNDLKLVTAVFVFLALIAPALGGRIKARLRQGDSHAGS